MIKSYTIAVICLLVTVHSISAQVLTLDSCYTLAVNNYPLIQQYDLIEKTKEYTLSNAGKAYLPQVSLTAIEGYVFGGLPSFGAMDNTSSNFKFIGLGQVNQTIWDGGATKTQKEIIHAASAVEKASVDVAMQDLRSRVSQLYFGVLLVDEQLQSLAVQHASLTQNLNRIKQLNDNGLAYKTDVDEIKVELLKLDQQKTEFTYTRHGYLTMLSLLIGAQITDQVTLTKPVLSSELTDLTILRPELSFYESQRNLINAQAGMQQVSLMPKIGFLGAGVLLAPGLPPGGNHGIGIAGLSASWNMNGVYKNNNNKGLTQQALYKIDVQEETFLFNTNLQMNQANANIQKQKAILAADDEIVNLRKTIHEGYQLKYDSGIGTLHDLLTASEKEAESATQKALHEMQLLMTLNDYKTITGK